MYNDHGYSRVGATPRLFGLSLLVLVLAFGGALWFDFLGLIDVTAMLSPALRWVGLQPRDEPVGVDRELLLEEERLGKREESLALRRDELNEHAQRLDTREMELRRLTEQLDEREASLQDREK